MFRPISGMMILLDGMLPQLRRIIDRTCVRYPETNIIVATDVDSFTIKYEVMHLNGAIYVSGPMDSDHFVKTVCNVATQEKFAAAS